MSTTWSPFDEEAANILDLSYRTALGAREPLGPEHVLSVLLQYSSLVQQYIARIGVDSEALREAVDRAGIVLQRRPLSAEHATFSKAYQEMLEIAMELSRQDSRRRVDTGHILLAMLVRKGEPTALLLSKAGIDLSDFASYIERSRQ